jgi:hypothetical protein
MRCVKAPGAVLVKQYLEGAMVGELVLPEMPDDVEPGAGEITRAVRMVASWGLGAAVQVGGPCGCIGEPFKITDTRTVYQ